MSKNNIKFDPKNLRKSQVDRAELENKLNAFEELNKKIPININKTLDPVNNSIGLYGLEDMVLLKIFDFHAV